MLERLHFVLGVGEGTQDSDRTVALNYYYYYCYYYYYYYYYSKLQHWWYPEPIICRSTGLLRGKKGSGPWYTESHALSCRPGEDWPDDRALTFT